MEAVTAASTGRQDNKGGRVGQGPQDSGGGVGQGG